MATITRGKTFGATETVTNSKLHQLVDSATISGITSSDLDSSVSSLLVGRNRLINASFRIDQRNVGASTAVADDVYAFDRWYILTQTASVNVSQLTDPEDGFVNAMRLTQNQASAQRMGFAQIIEGRNCKDLRGGNTVLVPRIRCSSSQAIRYAILAWTSTVDAVTSDVVNDWTSSTYTASNFFIANTSVIAIGTHTPSSDSWTSLPAISGAAGSTFNNIIIFVWTEGTAAQNVTLDVDFVQFEKGSTATTFERVEFATDVDRSQRYYQKTYDIGTAPGTATENGGINYRSNGHSSADHTMRGVFHFRTRMRASPTMTWYGIAATVSAGQVDMQTNGRTATTISSGETSATVEASNGGVTIERILRFHAVAAVEL